MDYSEKILSIQIEKHKEFIVIIDEKIKDDVVVCKQSKKEQYAVVYKNNPKEYFYSASRIKLFDKPINIDVNSYQFVIKASNTILFNVDKILSFDDKYYKIYYISQSSKIYSANELIITKNILTNESAKNLLEYYKKIAKISCEQVQGGENKLIAKSLLSQYEKIDFIDPKTIAAKFLNPDIPTELIEKKSNIIFPFGCNLSQISAVEKAINNQISIIEGPPGTGKTQTILNIIANALLEDKNLAIVSNNNSATDNVFEKLEKNGFSYLAAQLGKRDNIDNFFEKKQSSYPCFAQDKIHEKEYKEIRIKLINLKNELNQKLIKQNRNAVLVSQLADLKLEKKYFDSYFHELNFTTIEIFNANVKNNFSKTQNLFFELKSLLENGKKVSFWFKLKSVYLNGVKSFSVFKNDEATLLANLQKLFYITKEQEIIEELEANKLELENFCFEVKLKEFTENSMRFLRAKLANKYDKSAQRTIFTNEIRRTPLKFLDEYPIILSSTHAIKNTFPNHLYDYVIVDEASQVGLSTAFLTLSCAKRIVIVGDLKQLPNVIESPLKNEYKRCSCENFIPEKYCVEEHSLLSSATKVFKNVPTTLLKEHYRCHPKIIDFCNKRFYHNQLVIMSKDKGESDVLKVRITAKGNHARANLNHRQIDEIKSFVLPELNSKDVGIISPYRKQVEELQKVLPNIPNIATVHKFQGRENDDIIITTVDNEISEFTDNPNLLNVAVSRAKNRLVLIISDNEKNENTNTGGLVNYIKYNSFEVIQSDLYSVFDLLYKANEIARKNFLKKAKKISKYDSENIMYSLIEDVLSLDKFSHYAVGTHIALNTIIRNFDKIKNDQQKCNYAKNPATHVDFLIYNNVDKSPVLAIEVDGYSFHNETTVQSKRDKLKNEIFAIYNLPLLRFSTTGSMEKERLIKALENI